MILTISNEVPFQILSSSFSIGPSQTGYELQVGADSRSFSTLFSVGANTPRMVTNVANGSYFRLKNNVGDVKVNWQRVCVDEGGSGSGTELTPVAEFPLGAAEGTVVALASGDTVGLYQFIDGEWVLVGADDPTKLLAVNELPASAEPGTVMALYQEGEAGGGTWVYDETEDKWVFECDFSTLDTGETYDLGRPLYYDFFCVEFENITLFYSNGGWYAGCVFADRVEEECGEPYQHTILLSGSTPETTWRDERDTCGGEETYYNTKFGWDPTDQKLKCWAEGYDTSLCGPFTPEVNNITGGTPSEPVLGLYQYDGQNWSEVGADVDLSAYWTSAETKSYVDSAVSVFWASAETKDYVDSASTVLQEQIDTMDEVVSEALVDLNERIDEMSGGSQSDSTKLLAVNELPASAEPGTVMAQKPSLGFWSEDGLYRIYTITDLEGVNRDQEWHIANIMGYYTYEPTGYTNAEYRLFYQYDNPEFIGWRLVCYREKDGQSDIGAWDLNPTAQIGLLTGPLNEEGTKYLNIISNGPERQIIFYATDALVGGNVVPLEIETFSPGTQLGLYQYDGQNWNEVGGADLSNYYTKSETDSAITEVQDQIDTMDDVVSAALVDLNDRKVESTSVSTIWKGTQAQYDATTQSGATADPATLYIIVNNS